VVLYPVIDLDLPVQPYPEDAQDVNAKISIHTNPAITMLDNNFSNVFIIYKLSSMINESNVPFSLIVPTNLFPSYIVAESSVTII
jgi:hypothetical protein